MRGLLLLALPILLAAVHAAARAADGPDAPLRPSPAVLMDPAAWYSPALFTLKGEPQPGEWMAAHPEPAQSFQQYVASRPIRPTRGRQTIVLVPVGPMTAEDRARLNTLREFMEAYFTLPARLGPPLGLEGVTKRERSMFGLTFTQYLTEDLLYAVLPPAVPEDAFCLLGVTMQDLYPEPSWNYVFGQATLSRRVGVYSLVRFYPAFWNESQTPEADRLGLIRSLHTLVHETGHMFGVHHCQKYDCLMNGTNSLQESDTRPIHLCPDCLRKFRWNIGFDLAKRYQGLKAFYEAHGMTDQAAWIARRIQECTSGSAQPEGGQNPAAERKSR